MKISSRTIANRLSQLADLLEAEAQKIEGIDWQPDFEKSRFLHSEVLELRTLAGDLYQAKGMLDTDSPSQ